MTMSESRQERREQERQARKGYEALAKEIRERVEDLPQTPFTEAIQAGLSKLDMDEHPNNALAAQLILGCLDNVKAGRDDMGRLMLYVSGVIVSQPLTENTLAKIFG